MGVAYKPIGKPAPKDADTFAPDKGFAREPAPAPNKVRPLNINQQFHPPKTRKA